MQYINSKIDQALQAQKEKFGKTNLLSAVDYMNSGIVFEHNMRANELMEKLSLQMVGHAINKDFDKIEATVDSQLFRFEAFADATNTALSYTKAVVETHRNNANVKQSDKLFVAPVVGLYHEIIDERNEEEKRLDKQREDAERIRAKQEKRKYVRPERKNVVEHTYKDDGSLRTHILTEMSKETLTWKAMGHCVHMLQKQVEMFIATETHVDVFNYIFPQGIEKNGIGRMTWGCVLRAYFFIALAYKTHYIVEDGYDMTRAEYVKNQYAAAVHERDAQDGNGDEVGHYSSERMDELASQLKYVELQELVADMQPHMWRNVERLNKVAEWSHEVFNGTFVIDQFPQQDAERGERDWEAVKQQLENAKSAKDSKTPEVLFKELMEKAMA